MSCIISQTSALASKLDLKLYKLAEQNRMSKPSDNIISVRVFVKFKDKPDYPDGIEIISMHENLASMLVPVNLLSKLEKDENIISITAVKQLKPMVDAGNRDIRTIGNIFSPRSSQSPPYEGLTGKGVIIGVIDTGIDFLHRDFRNNDGTTRLIGLWDQTLKTGTPPAGYSYGRECTVTNLNSALGGKVEDCPQVDDTLSLEPGHGTHVTGIAAGDGSDEYLYTGVAPEADILFVKTDFEEDHVIDAMHYIEEKAAGLGKPYVINFSIGTQLGPHDATGILEEQIDLLGGSIVVSAGNWGDKGVYSGGSVANNSTATVKFHIPSYTPDGHNAVSLDIWYGGEDSISVELTSPSGYSLEAKQGEKKVLETSDGMIEISNAENGGDPNNNDNEVLIDISSIPGKSPTTGEWSITFKGYEIKEGGNFSIWIYENQLTGKKAYFVKESSQSSIAIPATAKKAISTGSHITKLEWTDHEQNSRTSDNTIFETGGISLFSSAGPTRDGRFKPEITAPGQVVASTLSASVVSYIGSDKLLKDLIHWINSGTSYAAPFVTGGIALLLQENSSLDAETISDIIRCSSRKENTFSGSSLLPDDTKQQSGYGKFDIAAALKLLRDDTAVSSLASGLSATAVNSTSDGIEISWTDDQNLSYELQRRTGREPLFRSITSNINGGNYLDISIISGEVYYYRLKSSNDICGTAFSDTVKIITPLDAPEQIFSKIISNNSIRLSWNITAAAEGYILERSEENESFKRAAVTETNTYIDDTVTIGSQYRYRISSYTQSTVSDDTSQEITVMMSGHSKNDEGGCGFLFTDYRNKTDFNDYIHMLILILPWFVIRLIRKRIKWQNI